MKAPQLPAPRGAGFFPKILFIAVAGMLIPPTPFIYGFTALASVERNRAA